MSSSGVLGRGECLRGGGGWVAGDEAEECGGQSADEGDDAAGSGFAQGDALLGEDSGNGDEGDEQARGGGAGVLPGVL